MTYRRWLPAPVRMHQGGWDEALMIFGAPIVLFVLLRWLGARRERRERERRLIVYGDFNCPYSALASARVDDILGRGIADVEWRAVEHDSDIPIDGQIVEGETRTDLEREVAEVRRLVRDGETFDVRVPRIKPNTHGLTEIFSTTRDDEAQRWRRDAFDAVWRSGSTLTTATGEDESLAGTWRREWEQVGESTVPVLVEPDGTVSRGVAALDRLADLLDR